MADPGDGFPLKGSGGGVKGAGGAEEDVVPPAGAHPREQMAGEDGRGAAAAGAATVNVLTLQIKDHQAAVAVPGGQIHPIPQEQLLKQLAPEPPQVACDDEVIEAGLPPGVLKVGADGVISGGAMAAPMLLVSVTPLSTTLPGVTWVR